MLAPTLTALVYAPIAAQDNKIPGSPGATFAWIIVPKE